MMALLGLLFTASINPQVLTVDLSVNEGWGQIATPLTVPELIAIATSSAAKYHLNKRQTNRMMKVIDCESGWVATSTGRLGERGLVQILPSAHPAITEEQMLDPYFALDFISREFSLKHYQLWSCYDLTAS